MERPQGGTTSTATPQGAKIVHYREKPWTLGRRRKNEMGGSPPRIDYRIMVARQGPPSCSYNQAAPEQDPSVHPCPPEPLPAFGVLWEGMVEAAWRGLL